MVNKGICRCIEEPPGKQGLGAFWKKEAYYFERAKTKLNKIIVVVYVGLDWEWPIKFTPELFNKYFMEA